MSEQATSSLSSEETKQRLKQLWDEAAVVRERPPEASTAQFLALGVDLRINFLSAVNAAWETAQAVIKGTIVAQNPFAVMTWLEAGATSVAAIRSIFDALVQRMRPIDYVTAVILSREPSGMTADELRSRVGTFLKDPHANDYAWYLGMTPDRIGRAREVINQPNWFDKSREELEDAGFLENVGDKLVFRSLNFTFGWKQG